MNAPSRFKILLLRVGSAPIFTFSKVANDFQRVAELLLTLFIWAISTGLIFSCVLIILTMFMQVLA